MGYRFRVAMLAGVLACFGVSAGGCGGGDDGKTIQVDEEREKALTESMRGYYENNP